MGVVGFCWKKTGVEGDHSCPRLPVLAHCRNCPEYAHAGRTLFERPNSEDARGEYARDVAEPDRIQPAEAVSVAVFRIAEEWFALPTGLFHEAVERRGIHVVPGRTNPVFRGLANVNGELVLVFSLAEAVGLVESDGAARVGRMCVVGPGADRVVFEAAEVLGVRRVSATVLKEPPSTVSKSPSALTRAVFRCEGRQVALLDEERLMERFFGSLVM